MPKRKGFLMAGMPTCEVRSRRMRPAAHVGCHHCWATDSRILRAGKERRKDKSDDVILHSVSPC